VVTLLTPIRLLDPFIAHLLRKWLHIFLDALKKEAIMEGQVIFYKGDRIIYRHHVEVHDDDYSKGVNDALIAFQRNYAGFDLADDNIHIRFKRPGDV